MSADIQVQHERVHGVLTTKAGPASHFRWTICALLFFATTLNYMDRQVLGLLKPTLQSPVRGIGMTEVQYAAIVSIFSAAYALGLLISGGFIDRVGTRIGYATALAIWTVASMSHTLVRFPAITAPLHTAAVALSQFLRHVPGFAAAPLLDSMAGLSGAIICFGLVRFVLGLGESGNFPAAIKAVAEWFPSRERALATGIFNSGTNIGATLAPFAVAFILYRFGWQFAFLGTAAFAAIWLVLWLAIYRAPQDHPRVSASELAFINSDPVQAATRIAWSHLLPHRQTWAFFIGKVLTDPIWWFYLYWLPGFLNERYGLTVVGILTRNIRIFALAAVMLPLAASWAPAQDAAPKRPEITGISHAGYFVSDLGRTIAFWHDLLGFDESYSLNKPGTDQVRIAFIKINDHQHIELFTDTPTHPPNMMSHLCFSVDNVEQMRAYLRSKGFAVKPGNGGKTRTGDYAFEVKDPDGTLIEFVQSLPTGMEAQAAGKFMPDTRIADSIYHVGFLVGNADKSIAFYHDVLGFREIWRGGSSPKEISWINMRVPDGKDYIEQMLYRKLPTTFGTKNHISLLVPSVPKAIEILEARPYYKTYLTYGKPLVMQIGKNGKRQVNLYDPDGTRVELMEAQTVDGKPVPSSTAPTPSPAHD